MNALALVVVPIVVAFLAGLFTFLFGVKVLNKKEERFQADVYTRALIASLMFFIAFIITFAVIALCFHSPQGLIGLWGFFLFSLKYFTVAGDYIIGYI
jgi:hypothetical protein